MGGIGNEAVHDPDPTRKALHEPVDGGDQCFHLAWCLDVESLQIVGIAFEQRSSDA